jgi:hypothetical protein
MGTRNYAEKEAKADTFDPNVRVISQRNIRTDPRNHGRNAFKLTRCGASARESKTDMHRKERRNHGQKSTARGKQEALSVSACEISMTAYAYPERKEQGIHG